jgi:hypothetical protein
MRKPKKIVLFDRPSKSMEALTVESIVDQFDQRTLWHSAEKSLTLQGKSLCRRLCEGDKAKGTELFERIAAFSEHEADAILMSGHGEPLVATAVAKLFPILTARRIVRKERLRIEDEYELAARSLPILNWSRDIPGIGAGSMAAVIGSTGNLWNYASVQKLWCRMGLAVMPDGRRHRNLPGPRKALGMAAYSPVRRSVMWNIGTSLMRVQSGRGGTEPGEYRKIYDARRAYEEEKNERGDYAPLAAAILKNTNFTKGTDVYKAYASGKLPRGHLKARAQRYMEKEFLKRLWVEWRRVMTDSMPDEKEAANKKKAGAALATPTEVSNHIGDTTPQTFQADDS